MLADQIPNDRQDADGDDEQLIELEAPWALLRHLADERAGHDPQEGDHEEVVAARHCHFGTHAPASCSTHPRHSWGRCRRQLLRGECAIAIASTLVCHVPDGNAPAGTARLAEHPLHQRCGDACGWSDRRTQRAGRGTAGVRRPWPRFASAD